MLVTKQTYLGISDAACKARDGTPWPGEWAGLLVHIIESLGVYSLTSEEKWDMLKTIIDKWELHLSY